jgi:hypothetical protein
MTTVSGTGPAKGAQDNRGHVGGDLAHRDRG